MDLLTIGDAVYVASENGHDVPDRTLRHACKVGYISARKYGRDWLLEKDSLIEYLNNRPRPGRKPAAE